MAFNFGSLRRMVMGVSLDIMDNFWAAHDIPDSPARQELRYTSSALIDSYNLAIEVGLSSELEDSLSQTDRDLLGFAHKGAGMGLIFLDFLSPGSRSRFRAFIEAHAAYADMIHIGAGIALWVLKKDIDKNLATMPPINRWWAMDGFGFYDGTSNWTSSLDKQQVPKRLKGYARRAYDQGLGRSIWFLYHTDIDKIMAQMRLFPEARHADLWSGIGLACTYTGGINGETLSQVQVAAGKYASDVAVGAALAVNGRYLADNIMPHTELASSILCGCPAQDCANMANDILSQLPLDQDEAVDADRPVYETYRQQLRTQLQDRVMVAIT